MPLSHCILLPKGGPPGEAPSALHNATTVARQRFDPELERSYICIGKANMEVHMDPPGNFPLIVRGGGGINLTYDDAP